MNNINLTVEAERQLYLLQKQPDKIKILKSVVKALGLMEHDLQHPSLHTHIYHSSKGPNGEKVFEAYAQNNTPGAYRIFWYYGPKKNMITVFAIIPHP